MDIYNAVSKKISNVSLTTIYNTMKLLKEEGMIRELPAVAGQGVRFDTNLNPHHHIICNDCGMLVDVDLKDIHQHMLLSQEQRKGFDVQKISIKIYGICPQCRNTETGQMSG